VLALLAGLLLYLQTRHAFRHVIVPLVASLVKGEFRARDGVVSLAGTVEIQELIFIPAGGTVDVQAERLVLDASLSSFFHGRAPLIHHVEVKHATVTVTVVDEKGGQSAPEHVEKGAGPSLLIPVSLDRGSVEGVILTVNTGNGAATVRNVTLEITHLTPGQTGKIGLHTDFLLDRGARKAPWSGTVALALDLEQNHDGTRLTWTGTNSLLLQEGRSRPERTDPRAITIEQAFSGDYDHATRMLRALSTVDAGQGQTTIGSVKAEFSLKGVDEQRVMNATLNVERVTPDALNAWLGGLAPVHFVSAQVDGQMEVNVVGTRVAVRSTLAGKQLQLRLEGQQGTSPPIDLGLDQVASFDQRTGDLTLDTLRVTVSDGARTLLAGTLDRPLAVNLDRVRAGAGGSSGGDVQPVAFTVTLDGVGVRDLRPWMALTGRDALAGVTSGEAEGAIMVKVQGNGETVDVTGRLDLTKLVVEGPSGAGSVGPLALENRVHATIANLATVTVDTWTTTLSLKGTVIGLVKASAAIQVKAPAKVLSADALLQLDGLPAEAFNPLLASMGPTRFQRAVLEGQGKVRISGDTITWQAALQGKQVSMRLPDTEGPSPPLDMLVEQAGTFDHASKTLRLEGLVVKVKEDRQLVIAAMLDRPLTVALDRGRTGSGGGARESLKPIALTLDLHHLDINQLRPWMAMRGSGALASVASGDMDGQLQIEIKGNADTVNLAGRLDLTDFRIRRTGAAATVGPLAISSRARAMVTDLAQVRLDPLIVQVSAGRKVLTQARVAGSADTTRRALDMVLDVTVGNLAEMLDRLGLLDDRQRQLIEGGDFKGEARVITAESNQPLKVTTALRSQKLTVKLDPRHALTRSITAQGEIEVNGARTEAFVNQFGMTLESNGSRAGTVAVTGHWPLGVPEKAADLKGARAPAGELAVTVKEWDGAPLADFFGLMPGREPGPLPITMQVVLGLDPGTQTVKVRGQETVGPLRLTRKGGGQEQATFHLEHDLEKQGDEIRVAAITLTSERPRGVADRVTLKGTVGLADRPHVQARGKVDSLDAGLFADLFSSPHADDQPPAPHESGDKADIPATERNKAKGFPIDLDVEAEIGSVTFRSAKLEKGRLVAKGAEESLHATLDQTGIAGGTVEGAVDITLHGAESQVSWSAKGRRLNVMMLAQALNPEREPSVAALASFSTEGKGSGEGPALKQSLTGTVVFDLTDGKFLKTEFLTYIAKQTRVKEFEEIGFESVHGDLQVKDGWIHVNRLHVEGVALTVDGRGKIGLDGQLDVKVIPKIGPRLARKAKGACYAPLLKIVDGLTVFPFAILVKGTIEKPDYSLEVTAGKMIEKEAGHLASRTIETLTGCGGSLTETGGKVTEETLDTIRGTTKDFFDSLLGTGNKKDRSP
jgi:hypothetical protein